MVIFKEIYNNPLIKNKNGTVSYSFSEDNYNAGKCGQGHTLTGDIHQGDPLYDAAIANMGEPWMMSTRTQCDELINTNYTMREWTTVDGINGYKFTNKTDSSKYIFLSSAGYWNNTSIKNNQLRGQYWINSYRSSIDSISIEFSSSSLFMVALDRYQGFSIRAIRPLEW